MKRTLALLALVASQAVGQNYQFRANPVPDTTLTLSIGTALLRWISGDFRHTYTDSLSSRSGTLNLSDSVAIQYLLTVGGNVDALTFDGFTLRQGAALSDTTKFWLKTDTTTLATVNRMLDSLGDHQTQWIAALATKKAASDSTALSGYVTGNRFLDSLDNHQTQFSTAINARIPYSDTTSSVAMQWELDGKASNAAFVADTTYKASLIATKVAKADSSTMPGYATRTMLQADSLYTKAQIALKIPYSDTTSVVANQWRLGAYSLIGHTQAISTVTGLQDSLNVKLNRGEATTLLATKLNYSDTTSLLAMQWELDGKALNSAFIADTTYKTAQIALKADKATTISAGTALSGGGDLSTNRTISADTTFFADANSSGFLSYVDWNTFNAKQMAGNYITALTGDVTATGPGSVAATVVDDSHAHTGATLSLIPIGDVTAAQDSFDVKLNRSEYAPVSYGSMAHADSTTYHGSASINTVGPTINGFTLASGSAMDSLRIPALDESNTFTGATNTFQALSANFYSMATHTGNAAIYRARESASYPYGISVQNRNATAEWLVNVDAASVDDKELSIGTATGVLALRLAYSTGAATFASTVLPGTSGNDLGSDTYRWELFAAGISSVGDIFNSGAAGTHRGYWWQTAGVNRWLISANNTAEGGGNAGTDLALYSYDDTGAYLGNPLVIARATGAATFASTILPGTSGNDFGSTTYRWSVFADTINSSGGGQFGGPVNVDALLSADTLSISGGMTVAGVGRVTGGTAGANVAGTSGEFSAMDGGASASVAAPGNGGALSLTSGTGGASNGTGPSGSGGAITILAGSGGSSNEADDNGNGGAVTISGGAGALVSTGSSHGGAVSISAGAANGIAGSIGGSITLTPGSGGASGTAGTIALAGATTVSGALAANSSGGITTNQTTFSLLDATATTVNFAGAATTIDMGTAAVNLTVGGANVKKTIHFDGYTDFLGGSATYNGIATPSSDREFPNWKFLDGADNSTYTTFAVPDNWDGGVVNVKIYWYGSSGASTGDVVWEVAGFSTSDGDTLDGPIGTVQTWTDANQAPVWTLNVTDYSPDLTLDGSPTAGDLVTIRIRRVTSNPADTYNSYDARMVSAVVRYGVNKVTE